MNVLRWVRNYKPVSITENFICCFVGIFFVIFVGSCGVFFASLFTEEQGWHALSGFLALLLFATSFYTIWMFRECARFRHFLVEQQRALPVRAKVNYSWKDDQTGYEVLDFSEGVILFDQEASFVTRSEWAFKKIMSSCARLNPAFVRTLIREPTYRI